MICGVVTPVSSLFSVFLHIVQRTVDLDLINDDLRSCLQYGIYWSSKPQGKRLSMDVKRAVSGNLKWREIVVFIAEFLSFSLVLCVTSVSLSGRGVTF